MKGIYRDINEIFRNKELSFVSDHDEYARLQDEFNDRLQEYFDKRGTIEERIFHNENRIIDGINVISSKRENEELEQKLDELDKEYEGCRQQYDFTYACIIDKEFLSKHGNLFNNAWIKWIEAVLPHIGEEIGCCGVKKIDCIFMHQEPFCLFEYCDGEKECDVFDCDDIQIAVYKKFGIESSRLKFH